MAFTRTPLLTSSSNMPTRSAFGPFQPMHLARTIRARSCWPLHIRPECAAQFDVVLRDQGLSFEWAPVLCHRSRMGLLQEERRARRIQAGTLDFWSCSRGPSEASRDLDPGSGTRIATKTAAHAG